MVSGGLVRCEGGDGVGASQGCERDLAVGGESSSGESSSGPNETEGR